MNTKPNARRFGRAAYGRRTFIGLTGLAAAAAAMVGTLSPAYSDWKVDPDAVQRIYMNGVPHTDKNGRPMTKYDPARSFLPISIYHAIELENAGVTYKLSDLKAAGFTQAFAWPGQGQKQLLKSAEACGLQMIFWNPEPEDVKDALNSPSMMGYCMDDEPIGHLGGDLEDRFAKMNQRRDAIRTIDKIHPVFLVDAGWITPPATSWWVKLNTWGEVSSHDNYPINGRNLSLSHTQGIPETVSFAVASNKEQKPVWFVVQNHEWLESTFNNNFPSIPQQRCMVYTAFVHGATGIVHFALDSFVTRDGRVIGIAPNPQAKYSVGNVATATQLRESKNLWDATVELNGQLNQLRPSLLSPTADIPYEISLDSKWQPITKDPIRTILKVNPAGGYTLILVNIDAFPQHVRLTFPNRKMKVTELFNAPNAYQLEEKDGGTEFMTTAWDARVFQIDPQ